MQRIASLNYSLQVSKRTQHAMLQSALGLRVYRTTVHTNSDINDLYLCRILQMKFESFSYLDKVTGKPHYYYKHNNVVCKHIAVETKKSKRLVGLTLIRADLRKVLRWLELIEENFITDKSIGVQKSSHAMHDPLISRALFVASLSTYGKCFTQAEGRGTVLSEKDVPEELRKTHELWMSYRHRYAAHSGDTSYEGGCVNVAYVIKNSRIHLNAFVETNQTNTLRVKIKEQSVHKLVEQLISVVEEMISKLRKKVVEEDFHEILSKELKTDKNNIQQYSNPGRLNQTSVAISKLLKEATKAPPSNLV